MTHLQHRTGGFWSRVKTEGGIDAQAWAVALGTGAQVGTCIEANCGGALVAYPAEDDDPRLTLYPARCVNCGHVVRGRSPRPTGGGR